MSPFVKYPSDVAPPPFDFFDFDSASFLLTPDRPQVLQDLTDELVNDHVDPQNALFRIHQSEPRVVLTVSDFPSVQSKDPNLGQLGYQEFVFSFAVFNEKKQFEKAHLCAYIWVDGPVSGIQEYFAWSPSATGRELYGLPKARGEIQLETQYFTGHCKNLPPPTGGGTIKPQLAVRISRAGTDLSLLPRSSVAGRKWRSSDESLDGLRHLRDRMRDVLERKIDPRIKELTADPLWREKQLSRLFWGHWDGFPYPKAKEFAFSSREAFALINDGSGGINLPLLGFRQLHDPVTHDNAKHQQVIAASFKFTKAHESLIASDYEIEILDPRIRDRLSLKPVYNIDGGTEAGFVADSDARFAENVVPYS